MSKVAVVLVHGMGAHQLNWSRELQNHLSARLAAFLPDINFFETVYSDIVEGEARLQAGEETPQDMTETAIAIEIAKLEATEDALLGPTEGPDVVVSGDLQTARQVLRDLQAYVVRYFKKKNLRANIHSRLFDTIGPAIRSVGGKQNLILIGHSLGSAIVWNLATDETSSVAGLRLLVTLASPLGWFERANVIERRPVRGRWINAGTPGDVVCHQSISEPAFWATDGLVSVWTRRFPTNPHGGLISDKDIVGDWAPMML
jgi:predicted alpha/beta hydrolase family esterase